MIKRDATMLLRPKTGLKDMVIEIDPGTQARRRCKEGYTIPVAQTRARRQPRRDPRQPRPRHARLPAAAGRGRRRGPEGQRRAPSRNAFRRFEPLNRDIAKLTGALAQAAPQPRAADPQPPAARDRGRHEGQGARRAGRLPERRVRGVREPGREPARDVPAAAGRAPDHEHRAVASPTELTDAARARRCASCVPVRARSRRRQRATRPFARQTIPPIQNQIRPFARAGAARRRRRCGRRLATWRRSRRSSTTTLRRPQHVPQRARLQPAGHRQRATCSGPCG